MNLVERVQAILLKPKATWPIIEGEPDDIAALVDPAAALPSLGYRGGERDAHPPFAADNADAGHDASPRLPLPLTARVARSRDTHRNRAISTGISTSLDANG